MQAQKLVEAAVVGEYQAAVEPEVEQHHHEQQGVGPDCQPDIGNVAVDTQFPEIVAVKMNVCQRHEPGPQRRSILRTHPAHYSAYLFLHLLHIAACAKQEIGIAECRHILRKKGKGIAPPVGGLRDIPEHSRYVPRHPLYLQFQSYKTFIQTGTRIKS